ncbi:hypothetical protein J7E70_29415 [Variovorax paradoxus]|nr:hypothetical protein [Variovorax paradoxus]MBT2304550.1 hypothetical protein [Variovorax paradoxus]
MNKEENRIACIGWGSLVWDDSRDLPLLSGWRENGPSLPVEFARESGGSRITLVICKDTPRVQTLWAIAEAVDVATARRQLGVREHPPASPEWIETEIGYWDKWSGKSHGGEAETIAAWAESKGLAGVVWTNLPCGFSGKARRGIMPPGEAIVAHLRGLAGEERAEAEKYVRRAPAQIDTPYRKLIAEQLGWD